MNKLLLHTQVMIGLSAMLIQCTGFRPETKASVETTIASSGQYSPMAASREALNASVTSGPNPLTVVFSGVVNSGGDCAAKSYAISYSDNGADQIDVPSGKCAPQPYSIPHTFIRAGQWNVQLFQGTIRQVQLGQGIFEARQWISSGQDALSASVINGAAPLAVTFNGVVNNLSSCAAQSFTISLGDNQAYQIDVPQNLCRPMNYTFSHVYTSPGVFQAQLFTGTIAQVQALNTTRITGQFITAAAAPVGNLFTNYFPQNLAPGSYCTTAEGYQVPLGTTLQMYFADIYLSLGSGSGGNGEEHSNLCSGLQIFCRLPPTNTNSSAAGPGWYRWGGSNLTASSAPDVNGRLADSLWIQTSTPYVQAWQTHFAGGCAQTANGAQVGPNIVCSNRGCLPGMNMFLSATMTGPGDRMDLIVEDQIRTVQFTNHGPAPLPNVAATVTRGLLIVNNTCNRAMINPGEACQISVSRDSLVSENTKSKIELTYAPGPSDNKAYYLGSHHQEVGFQVFTSYASYEACTQMNVCTFSEN